LISACLLNKPKTKVQTWLIYKQTNMNEPFYQDEQFIHLWPYLTH